MASEEKEAFLSRWSRLKREREERLPEPPVRKNEEPLPALPPVEKLTPESDFAPFMHPKVADALRRVALKKLFTDPHFKVPDPYEPFSGDWTGGEPIPEELLKSLKHARNVLYREEDTKAEGAQQAEGEEPKKEDDEPGRQDA